MSHKPMNRAKKRVMPECISPQEIGNQNLVELLSILQEYLTNIESYETGGLDEAFLKDGVEKEKLPKLIESVITTYTQLVAERIFCTVKGIKQKQEGRIDNPICSNILEYLNYYKWCYRHLIETTPDIPEYKEEQQTVFVDGFYNGVRFAMFELGANHILSLFGKDNG